MDRAEVTELFAALMLAYPNAEMFRAESGQALKEKLAPTITLWTACLRDVDFWTGQKAVIRVCQSCKFPPTIAELREAAEQVARETEREIGEAFLEAKNACELAGGDGERALQRLRGRARKTVEAMGGMQVFAPAGKACYELRGFTETYKALLRRTQALPGRGAERSKLG